MQQTGRCMQYDFKVANKEWIKSTFEQGTINHIWKTKI